MNEQAKPAGLFDQVRQFLPTLLVFVLLGAVGGWGIANDWKFPSNLGELLTGKKAGVEEDKDWCKPHAAPRERCVLCSPQRWPPDPDFGWCSEHGVYNCVLEHPADLAQLQEPPTVSDVERQRIRLALQLMPRPENDKADKSPLKRVQLASDKTVKEIGLEMQEVQRGSVVVVESVSAPGEITYSQDDHISRVNSRLPGVIWRVTKKVGDKVERGEVLALVEAPEIGKAKTEFLQAFTDLELKRRELERQKTATSAFSEAKREQLEKEVEKAVFSLQSAEQTLLNLDLPIRGADLKGFTPAQVGKHMQALGLTPALAQMFATENTFNLMPLRAKIGGVVVDRDAVPGEVIDTRHTLLTVADVSKLWLTLEVRLEDAKYVKLGQEVLFKPDGHDEEVGGTIDWISTQTDPKTRTIKARVPLANPDGKLRDRTFGLGRVMLRRDIAAIVVPNEALHWTGGSHVVFVRGVDFEKKDAPKVFHVRGVRPGARMGETTEIIVGLLPGEVIATTNSGVLRGELLKAKIGAGEGD